ncbi:hypothetical protein AgCh_032852 [Apium graveolens]
MRYHRIRDSETKEQRDEHNDKRRKQYAALNDAAGEKGKETQMDGNLLHLSQAKLRLVANRQTDGRNSNNPPNAHEFAALIVEDNLSEPRDIVVEYKGGTLKRISVLNPSFMALQYPLIFTYGEDGYRTRILHRGVSTTSKDKRNVKRGLPHAHIVVWLDESDKCKNTDDIDLLISAEIPDKEVDPVGYESVLKIMVHGLCGELNSKCACMKDHKCTKFFPKDFSNETIIDSKGYAVYKRRNDGRTIMCKDVAVDNRFIVPYNRGLIVKYQAHINVEWCNQGGMIKYMFKYVTKGPDRATMAIEKSENNEPDYDDNNEDDGKRNKNVYALWNNNWRLMSDDIEYKGRKNSGLRNFTISDQHLQSLALFDVDSQLPELIVQADLLIWDEAPLNHKHVFEAVDRSFRDIMRHKDTNNLNKPFGGKTVLLGGDFRQILPVLPGKGRANIVMASINNSYLWDDCVVFKLDQNMRIEAGAQPVTISGKEPSYFRDRAILTPLNENVDAINKDVLDLWPGQSKVYFSSDSICKGSSTLFHVQLALHQIDEYIGKIQLRKIYKISDFITVAAGISYRPVRGDKIIKFTRDTVIQGLGNEIAIPKHGFELTTFSEAISKVGETETLMDVVGKLKAFSPIQSLSNDKEKLEIILQDDNVTSLSDADFEGEIQNFNNANLCDDTANNLSTNKRKRPEKQEKRTKEIKDLSKVAVNNKSNNADACNKVLNKEHTTTNKKKIQIKITKKADNKPRLLGNVTKEDAACTSVMSLSDADFKGGLQNFKNANLCDKTVNKLSTNKRKLPEKKEKMTNKIKDHSKVPVNNKAKNADACNRVLNKENATSNEKKIQITTTKKEDKKPRLLGNATKKNSPQESDNKAQSSATTDGTTENKKIIYKRKTPTKISTGNKKTDKST